MVAHVVDLEGGVGDAVLVSEELFEFAPAGVAVFVLADEDVGGEGREARGDGPDVEVVDLDYAFGGCYLLADFPGVQAARRRFEKDVGRVSEECPGAAQDQEPDGARPGRRPNARRRAVGRGSAGGTGRRVPRKPSRRY